MTTNDSDLLQAIDQALNERSLTWAAQWIEDSLKGETNERVIEFGKNMAMTLRAAGLPDARRAAVAGPGGDVRKLARKIIDAVINSPCIVEVRMFSQPDAVEKLEDGIIVLLPAAASSATPAERTGWTPGEFAMLYPELSDEERQRILDETTAPPESPRVAGELVDVAYPCVVDEKTLFACLQTAEQVLRKPEEPKRLERFHRTKAKLFAQAKASHLPLTSTGDNARRAAEEPWRQGMKDAAKEVCDACSNEERYGPARKIEGSTRWWHGEHADFQCEAGGIWHALEAAAAPADNDAELSEVRFCWVCRSSHRLIASECRAMDGLA